MRRHIFDLKEVQAALRLRLRKKDPVGFVHDDGYYLCVFPRVSKSSPTIPSIVIRPSPDDGYRGGSGNDFVEWLTPGAIEGILEETKAQKLVVTVSPDFVDFTFA